MKTNKLLITSLIFCFITSSVFSQTNTVLSYLPENFKLVAKINPVSLLLKVRLDELSKNKMFEDLMKNAPANGKQVLGNPLQSGINFGKGIFIVNAEMNDKPEIVFYAVPSNTTQLEATIKKIFPDKSPVKIGENNLIVNKHMAIAWNNEILIMTGDEPKKDSSETDEASESLRIKELTDRCTSLMTKHEPLQNDYLLSVINDQSDFSFCRNNMIKPHSDKKTSALLNMFGQNTINKGAYSVASINFENGKIVVAMKQFVDRATNSLFNKYVTASINAGLLKKLPSGNPIILCSFSLPLELIKESMSKISGEKGPSEDDKKKMDEIFSSVKGDLMVAIMKANDVPAEDTVTKSMGGMEVFIAGGISDKEKFKALNDLLESKSQKSSEKNPLGKTKPVIFSNETSFVISLSPYLAQQFLTATDNKEISELIEPYKNNPSFFMIDLKTVFGFMMQSFAKGKSEEDMKQATEVIGLFDKLIAYSSSHTDKYIETKAELTLTNKDENSFMQFLNLINVMYSMKPKKPKTESN